MCFAKTIHYKNRVAYIKACVTFVSCLQTISSLCWRRYHGIPVLLVKEEEEDELINNVKVHHSLTLTPPESLNSHLLLKNSFQRASAHAGAKLFTLPLQNADWCFPLISIPTAGRSFVASNWKRAGRRRQAFKLCFPRPLWNFGESHSFLCNSLSSLASCLLCNIPLPTSHCLLACRIHISTQDWL